MEAGIKASHRQSLPSMLTDAQTNRAAGFSPGLPQKQRPARLLDQAMIHGCGVWGLATGLNRDPVTRSQTQEPCIVAWPSRHAGPHIEPKTEIFLLHSQAGESTP